MTLNISAGYFHPRRREAEYPSPHGLNKSKNHLSHKYSKLFHSLQKKDQSFSNLIKHQTK